jgi:hypothetical protein
VVLGFDKGLTIVKTNSTICYIPTLISDKANNTAKCTWHVEDAAGVVQTVLTPYNITVGPGDFTSRPSKTPTKMPVFYPTIEKPITIKPKTTYKPRTGKPSTARPSKQPATRKPHTYKPHTYKPRTHKPKTNKPAAAKPSRAPEKETKEPSVFESFEPSFFEPTD